MRPPKPNGRKEKPPDQFYNNLLLHEHRLEGNLTYDDATDQNNLPLHEHGLEGVFIKGSDVIAVFFGQSHHTAGILSGLLQRFDTGDHRGNRFRLALHASMTCFLE